MIAGLAPDTRWSALRPCLWRATVGAFVGLLVGVALCLLLIAADPFGLLEVRKVRRGEPVPDLDADVQRMVTAARWLLFTPVVLGALLACWRRWPR